MRAVVLVCSSALSVVSLVVLALTIAPLIVVRARSKAEIGQTMPLLVSEVQQLANWIVALAFALLMFWTTQHWPNF